MEQAQSKNTPHPTHDPTSHPTTPGSLKFKGIHPNKPYSSARLSLSLFQNVLLQKSEPGNLELREMQWAGVGWQMNSSDF